MIITFLNHSDSLGGASVVTMRLMRALVRLGVDARMLVMRASGTDMRVDELRPAWRRKACFLAECARIYAGNGMSRRDLFKVSVAYAGMPVSEHPWVRDADVVVLSWVNQGMISLSEIARIQAPVAWMMHDMWCFTGVCHHAGECERYKDACGECKFLGRMAGPRDLSASTLRRKAELYSRKPINFVAVSQWLRRRCLESSLCRGQRVECIPNAFPVEEYATTPTMSRAALGLPEGKRLIVMAAARLDDPIKGLPLAVEALNALHAAPQGRDCAAVMVGAIRDPRALEGLQIPHADLGMVSDPARMAQIYAHADAVLSSSLYETLPGTLVEGMAAGCVPVAFDRGGQSDIVDHMRTGYLAPYPDTAALAQGLSYALTAGISRESQRREVAARFAADRVAARYLALFESLTR